MSNAITSAIVKLAPTGPRGTVSLHSLGRYLELQPDLRNGFLVGRMNIDECEYSANHGGQIDLLICPTDHVSNEKAIRAFLIKATKPQVRTPLTRENLLIWAQQHARTIPTYTDEKYDPVEKTTRVTTHQNTPARELALLLQSAAVRDWAECGRAELREEIASMAWDGCKGYKDYTEDETLDEIMSELSDPDESPYEFNDLEDLLEELL